jgi:hypothetical protein
MSDLVERARAHAVEAHRRINHTRKYTKEPYDTHLRAVAEIVEQVGGDEEMIAAAWLHDVVEDTEATIDDVERDFGAQVAALVADLTDVSRPSDGPRAKRKEIDRQHTAKASARAKTIKLADLLHNTESICKHDLGFARVYVKEARLLQEVLREGDARLFEKLDRVLAQCEARLKKTKPEVKPAPLTVLDPVFLREQRRAIEVFGRAFRAKDIAERLILVDEAAELGDRAIAGLRSEQGVRAYIDCDGPGVVEIAEAQVIAESALLVDVIIVLTRFQWCFVESGGAVEFVIGRHQIESPVVRVWLFGFITVAEMVLTESIRTRWPDGSWTQFLTPSRFEKARELQDMRLARGQRCDLLDCVQLSEKARILIQNKEELERLGFTSVNSAKQVIKELESLRNNLAHSQDFVTYDWPQIVRLARRFEELLSQ